MSTLFFNNIEDFVPIAAVGAWMTQQPMKVIIQIYEIQNPTEAERLIRLGVDHIGSVVVSPQCWKVPDIYHTIRMTESAGAKASLIPLFSDVDMILKALDYYHPHIVHFCESLIDGSGDLAACRRALQVQENVRRRFPDIAVMRSIPIRSSSATQTIPSLEAARMFEPVSDYFLTDTLLGAPEGAGENGQPVSGFVGITGKICDWNIAKTLVETSSIPVILGGGMSPDNVGEGIVRVRPAGVDSCTLTNAVDGNGGVIRFKKDIDKVARFIRRVRSAETVLEKEQP